MNIKKTLILASIIISNTLFSQQTLNDYKYVIVPKKYDFLKSEDQYQLNSLTKFLFKKEGFTTLFDTDSRSQELATDACLGLTSRIKKSSNMFSTKLVIELLNCKNEVVHTSSEGKSKLKDYKKAYQEALRNAFESIESLNYKYNPVKKSVADKTKEVVVEEKPTVIEKEIIPDKVEIGVEEVPIEVVEDVTAVTKEVTEPKKEIINKAIQEEETAIDLFYAQKNNLGYQLVDSTPKVVYILLKSSKDDVYLLKNKKGIVYKENSKWIVEYYELDKLVQKTLAIKF